VASIKQVVIHSGMTLFADMVQKYSRCVRATRWKCSTNRCKTLLKGWALNATMIRRHGKLNFKAVCSGCFVGHSIGALNRNSAFPDFTACTKNTHNVIPPPELFSNTNLCAKYMQDTGLVTTRQTDKSAFNNIFTFILPTKVSYQAVYTSVRLP